MSTRSMFLAVMCTLLLVGSAPAQIFSSVEFAAATPFTVGNATVPPGKYIIRLTDDPGTLEIVNPSGTISVPIEVAPSETRYPAKRTVVTFDKYGERLVLKSVAVEGQETGALSSKEVAELRHMRRSEKPSTVETSATAIDDEYRAQQRLRENSPSCQ